jgi:hypothetical protein
MQQKKRTTSIRKQGGVQEEATIVLEEYPTLEGLQMVVHEQSPDVVKEEHRANICTLQKIMKRAVRKLTLKKNLK